MKLRILNTLFAILILSSISSCQTCIPGIGHFFPPQGQVIPPVEENCYGYLYNHYAVTDSRKISNHDDWTVPTETEVDNFETFLSSNGGKLKETGFIYWNSPNTGATNEYGFNARGSGGRNESTGAFTSLKSAFGAWTSTGSSFGIEYSLSATTDAFGSTIGVNKKRGRSIRLIKNATGVTDGTQTTYTGNDGKVYPAIAINGKYWLQQNLEETEYRNGDTIPNVTDNTTWSGLTTGAWCVYNNNDDYKCK